MAGGQGDGMYVTNDILLWIIFLPGFFNTLLVTTVKSELGTSTFVQSFNEKM
jgi:hypothetical protein